MPSVGLVFVLLLIVLTIYVLDRSTNAVLQLRRLSRDSFDDAASRKVLERLRQSLESVRQTIQFSFYAFGCCFFLMLCMSVNQAATRSNPRSWTFLTEFGIDFSFATDVFLVFLFLHTVPWVVWIFLHKAMNRAS